MPEFWIRVGGLLVLMCGLPYLQACWGMPVKLWEGEPPWIGRVGGGWPGWRMPQDQWLGDRWRFGCWASFSTCICSWASVLCLGCWPEDPVRVKGGPSPLGPGFICWKGNCWGPLGCRAELFSTTREPKRKKKSLNDCNCLFLDKTGHFKAVEKDLRIYYANGCHCIVYLCTYLLSLLEFA